MILSLANDADMQFGAVDAAAVVVPGPVVADLVAKGLLGWRRAWSGGFTCLFLNGGTSGGKEIGRNEERLFEPLETIAPFHQAEFESAKDLVMIGADRWPLESAREVHNVGQMLEVNRLLCCVGTLVDDVQIAGGKFCDCQLIVKFRLTWGYNLRPLLRKEDFLRSADVAEGFGLIVGFAGWQKRETIQSRGARRSLELGKL